MIERRRMQKQLNASLLTLAQQSGDHRRAVIRMLSSLIKLTKQPMPALEFNQKIISALREKARYSIHTRSHAYFRITIIDYQSVTYSC